MKECKEYFNPNIIFAFDDRSPIIELGIIINDSESTSFDWVNENLKDLFNHDSEGGGTGKGDNLSLDYFLNRQDRIFSPLFDRLSDYYLNIEQQTEEERQKALSNRIALLILTRFLHNWSKLADAVFSEYNPIENYNMSEKRATLLEEVTNTENEETTKNKYSGFNTDEMKDVSESGVEGSIDSTKTTTGGKTNNELERSGNIGVTTTQQMIESSFKLAMKKILDLIYRDIDSILFIDYYN